MPVINHNGYKFNFTDKNHSFHYLCISVRAGRTDY